MTMKQPDLATEIDMFGRMIIALEEIEACREFVSLIPEVRTNMVFAQPHAKTPDEVMAVDGRITIVNGMPRAAGRVRFGASGHMARLIIELMKTDPTIRAGIDFANPPGFSDWLSGYCTQQGWVSAMIDRRDEPGEIRHAEGSSMQWKAAEAVRVAGEIVPKIICDAGGMGKEPVCIIVGDEPIGVVRDLCGIARAYVQSLK
jgi:hydroxymethylpyrimidine/phosphomethylpyrimidine kinase